MGMYDSLVADDPRLVCAAGHRLEDLQTKDLECDLTTYHLVGGRLYGSGERRPTRENHEHVATPEVLTIRSTTQVPHCPLTTTLRAYTHCNQCRPVLMAKNRAGMAWDMIDQREPWCEYALTFQQGQLVSVEPVRVESREDIRKELIEQGQLVLEDSNPVAVRHFERMAQKGRSWL